jgi:hypothetical protein
MLLVARQVAKKFADDKDISVVLASLEEAYKESWTLHDLYKV